MARILLLQGGKATPFELTGHETIIGRSPECGIMLDSPTVSRRHARLVLDGDNYSLEDLQTRNGTFVNDTQVTGRTQLADHDRLRFGSIRCLLELKLGTTAGPLESRGMLEDAFDINIVPGETHGHTIVGAIPVSAGSEMMGVPAHVKLKAVLEISRSLARATELEDLLPKLLETLLRVFFPQADRGCILLKDEGSGRMIPAAQKHRQHGTGDTTKLRDTVVQLSQTILDKVLREKTAILSSDATGDTRFQASESVTDLTIRCVMCVPMLSVEGEPIGIINIDTTDPMRKFTRDDVELLMAIAGQAALSYDSTRQLLKRQQLRADMEIERHRSLAQMVAGMAHEINTPIGIVNSSASLVNDLVRDERLQALATDAATQELVRDIAEATQLMQGNIARANRLIEDFKKLSVRQLTDAKEELDLPGLVDEIVSLFKVQARKASLILEIKNNLSPEQRRWSGYPGHLSQVLLNLLTNVQRYAYPEGQGGTIEIELSTKQQGEEPGFVVQVRDFGCGIPAEHLSQIFEPFFTTGRDRGGSGLGLAIVHNLVTGSLKGTIQVQSSPGAGTTFTLTFPQDVPEASGLEN